MTPSGAASSTQEIDLSFLVASVLALTVLYSFTINILFGHQTYWRSLEEWIPRHMIATLSHLQQFTSSYAQPSSGDRNSNTNSQTTMTRSKKRSMEKTKESIRMKSRAQLGELDDNVLVHILTYLPAADIVECSHINKGFARACTSRYLWSLKWREIHTRFPAKETEGGDASASPCGGMQEFFTRCWYLRHSLLTTPPDIASNAIVVSPNDEDSWPSTCPVLINGDVYELRGFLRHHPGGALILLEWKGQDASTIFNLAAHSQQAKVQMKQFVIWEQREVLGRRGWPQFVMSSDL